MIAAQPRQRGRLVVLTAFVCLLCTLPYWRALTLPSISDTYVQVWLGRHYGPISQLPALAADALYRCRATSIWLTAITDSIFGFSQPILYIESLLLHLVNVCLIAALGRWPRLGFQISIPAALLWGLNERHHEAVIWYAALPEQLVFFFVLLTVLLWLEWWQNGKAIFYWASLASFILALLSKESAVAACALIALPLIFEPQRYRQFLRAASPFFLLSLAYFAFNVLDRSSNLHWNDGTFRIGWHFIPVLFNSTARLFSFWGLAAIALLAYNRKIVEWRVVYFALAWIPICLAPYVFIAYMPRVPSRHVYLASLGVALLISVAVRQLLNRRKTILALLALYLVSNTAYIWFYKHNRFMERANVTEHLIRDAKLLGTATHPHALQVSCFPLAPEIAVLALSHHLGLAESNISVDKTISPACVEPQVHLVMD